MSCATLYLLTYLLGIVNADDTLLVQTRLAGSNTTGSAPLTPPSPLTLSASQLYRFVFTKTYGADHSCLTEIEFLDAYKKQLIAKYRSQSSCYGCAISCDDCQENYGNPTAQFDQISSSDAFNAWSCTDVGTFTDGVGKEELQFTLDERPTMVVMKYPHTDGLWMLRDFIMQVKTPTGDWETIATMVDAPQNVEQFFFVQMYGALEKPMAWPIQYDLCGLYAESPVEVQPDKEGFAPTIKAAFSNLDSRMLVDMSTEKGLMFAVDGDFGTITIKNPRMHQGDGIEYEIRQVTVNFPATHRFRPAGEISAQNADIEAHFIMQQKGSFGVFDLAVVTLLLDLPKETAPVSNSVLFWRQLGLENLPKAPRPKAIPLPIDFSVFSAQFAGGVSTLKCAPDVDWYLLHEPAYVSGSILHAMKVGPIAPEDNECDLLFGAEGAAPKVGASLEPAKDLSDDEKVALEQKRNDCEQDRAQRKQAQLQLEQSQDAKAQPSL